MTSFRSPALFGALARNFIVSPVAVYRVPSYIVPYARPFSQLRPIHSIRSSVRWYTSTSIDDARVYTFKEIDSLSKSLKDKYIIDVREPSELQQEGKIPNAINLPLSTLKESLNLSDEAFYDKFSFSKPEKDKEVIFYCKAGVRSTNASQIAKESGYTKIGNYKGSFDDWIASKGTIAKV